MKGIKPAQKSVAIIQSRLNSERLPAKAMLDLGGKPLLHRVIDRVEMARKIDDIWLATSTSPYDSVLTAEAVNRGINVFRGSLDDVLGRIADTVRWNQARYLVRITGDNPLIAPEFIDGALTELQQDDRYDLVMYKKTPYGSNVEAITARALLKAAGEAATEYDREHVTSYIKKNPDIFSTKYLTPPTELMKPHIRLTLDTIEDYHFLYHLFTGFMKGRSEVPLSKVLAHIEQKAKAAENG